MNCHVDVVELLLEKKANPNLKNCFGCNALLYGFTAEHCLI